MVNSSRRFKFLCIDLFLCLLLPGVQTVAWASNTLPAIELKSDEQDVALEQVREELTNLERRWYGLVRARWAYPQKISAGFGAIFVEQPSGADCSVTCMLHGWQFEVEPGLYGIQGSVGWGKLVGETGRMKHLIHSVHFAWAIRGVVMRTWGDSPLTPQSQTLAGIEGSISVVRFNFSLGLMRSLSSRADDDWVFSAGLGLGF